MFASESIGKIECSRLFRVRECNGRKSAIRLVLLEHDRRLIDAGEGKQLLTGVPPDAMHRGVNNLRLWPNRGCANQIRGRIDVFVQCVLTRTIEIGRLRNRIESMRCRNLRDLRGDVFVARRNDLRTTGCPTEVHLVSVVARRVVRCRHHDARRSLPVLGSEGQHRCRNLTNQPRIDARTREDLRAVFGKNIAVNATIETDDDPETAILVEQFLAVFEQVCGNTRGSLRHQNAVHAVWSGPEFAAQPSGAEANAGAKTRLELSHIACCD